MIGLLICLTSIFYNNIYWIESASSLPELAQLAFPIGFIITIVGLSIGDDFFYISKKKESYVSGDVSTTSCPNCNKKHDIDYPQCPYCGHK